MARVLVIEDNPANLELMTYLLQAFGHQTLTAMDGAAGLALAEVECAEVIICDVHLPKLDGYQVAARLKAHARLCKTPLIAVTALAMVGDREKLLAAGFDGYIAKPIDPEAFAQQIAAFVPGSVSLPARSAPATTSEGALARDTDAAGGSRAHILIVDDAPANRELARATLEPSGYRVTVAADVAQALALLQSTSFDLIVSDLHMPSADGFSLLTTLKADPRLSRIPFLLLSASIIGESDRLRGLALGATDSLLRPMEPQQLLDAVATCLSASKEA